MSDLSKKIQNIKCLICDIDGVLTDGRLYIDNYGNELKAFNVQDGMGLVLLMAAGIEVAVITTAKNDVIEHRMHQLGIKHYFTGQVDKSFAFKELKSRLNLTNGQFAYIGDDLPDLAIIKQVGFGIAVRNAVRIVRENAVFITEKDGGCGAVSEICDLILHANNLQEIALQRYLAL